MILATPNADKTVLLQLYIKLQLDPSWITEMQIALQEYYHQKFLCCLRWHLNPVA